MAVGVWMNGTFNKQQELFNSYFFNVMPEFISEDVVLIDKFDTGRLQGMLRHDAVKFSPKYDGSWSDVVSKAADFITKHDIDTMIVFKTDMRNNFRYGLERSGVSLIERVAADDQYGVGYATTRTQISNLMFVKAAADVCDNVYQYAIDPDEPRLDALFEFGTFRRLFFNACRRQNAICMPYYEYALLQDYHDAVHVNGLDFCFHASAVNESRAWLAAMKDDLEAIDGTDIHINVAGMKKPTRQSDYFWTLLNSRFTVVIEAYDPESFSWPRFVEAAVCGCLPLVTADCNLQDIRGIFPDVTELIENELTCDSIEHAISISRDFPESKRLALLGDIMNSDSLRRVTDLDWLSARWSSLKGLGGTK